MAYNRRTNLPWPKHIRDAYNENMCFTLCDLTFSHEHFRFNRNRIVRLRTQFFFCTVCAHMRFTWATFLKVQCRRKLTDVFLSALAYFRRNRSTYSKCFQATFQNYLKKTKPHTNEFILNDDEQRDDAQHTIAHFTLKTWAAQLSLNASQNHVYLNLYLSSNPKYKIPDKHRKPLYTSFEIWALSSVLCSCVFLPIISQWVYFVCVHFYFFFSFSSLVLIPQRRLRISIS